MRSLSGRRLGLAGVVALAGGALNAGSNLVLAVLLGRSLGADGAGAFFTLVAGFAIVANVLELGADTGLVRFVSAVPTRRRVGRLVRLAVRPVLAVGLSTAAVAALAAPRLAEVTGLEARVGSGAGGLIVAAAVGCLMAALTMVLLGAVRGLSGVLPYTVIQNVLLPGLRLVLVAVALWAGGDLLAVMLGWLLPLGVALGAAVVVLRRLHRRADDADPAAEDDGLGRTFWNFSAARGFAAAVEITLEWADVVLIAMLLPLRESGIYAVVTRCARAGELVQQAVRLTLGPPLSRALADGRTEEVVRINRRVSRLMVFGAWPCYLLVACFAPAVLGVFGPEFVAGAPALAILCLGMGLATAAGSAQTILLMGGRSRLQLLNKSLMLVLNVGLNLVLVPRLGITGAAVAWSLCILLDTALTVGQLWRAGIPVLPLSAGAPGRRRCRSRSARPGSPSPGIGEAR